MSAAALGQVNSGQSNHIAQGLIVFSAAVSETKGFLQISEFAIATISFFGKAFAKLPAGAYEFSKHLQSGIQVLVIVNLVNDLKWWFCDTRQSWQHTAHKATLIMLEILQTAVFFDSIKIINLSKISGNLGKVPIIGLAVTVLTSATTIFSIWHHVRKIVALKKDSANLIAIIKNDQTDPIALPTYRARLKAVNIEKNKTRISILSDISSIAFCILALVGVSTGVAVLALNSWLMVVLGLVVASIGVYDVIYGKAHPAPAA